MNDFNEETVELNGTKVSLKEFAEKKKQIDKEKGVKLIEVEPGVYKTRILG